MRKLFGVLVGVILAVMLIADVSVATLNQVRSIFQAATESNQVDGYWAKTANVTAVYVNYYPTGRAYTFVLDCDSANTVARSGASFVPAIVDIPLWPHHGVIGSYAITVSDTGTGWLASDDSLHALIELRAVAATTIYDSVDSIFYSERSKGILVQTLLDSTDGNLSCEIDKTDTGILGVEWGSASAVQYPQSGEVDLSAESKWYERLRIYAMQAGVNNSNSTTCVLTLRLWLPYSESYRLSPYYEKNEVVK